MYHLLRLAGLTSLLLVFAACASTPRTKSTQQQPQSTEQRSGWYVGRTIEGVASWYGDQFHGKKTANGEIYDMNKMTAAHKSMPLGSVIRVTNLDNGKNAEVRVNDRGPYAHGRILDLSRAAAETLGYRAKGTANVRAEIIKVGDNRYAGGSVMALPDESDNGESASKAPSTAQTQSAPGQLLVVGEYDSRVGAERLYYYLRGRFKTCKVVSGGEGFKVVIGPFTSENSKRTVYRRLKREGYDIYFE